MRCGRVSHYIVNTKKTSRQKSGSSRATRPLIRLSAYPLTLRTTKSWGRRTIERRTPSLLPPSVSVNLLHLFLPWDQKSVESLKGV